jgi:two-component system, cell cycle sensor histidine kinase and response regulator CckA
VGYLTASETGWIEEANLTAATLLGMPRRALVGQPLSRFILPQDQDIFYLHRKQLFSTGNPQECELRLVKPGGAAVWTHLSAVAAQGEHGEPVCRVTINDITDHKRAEEELRHREKQIEQLKRTESLARMAGGIAHYYNNLMMVVLGNLELAADKTSDPALVATSVTEALKASQRAATMGRMMLTYLGQTMGNREPLELAEVCREALAELSAGLSHNARFEAPLQEVVILADAAQVKQVLANLVINAAEALGERPGDITVTVAAFPASAIPAAELVPTGWNPNADNYACLSVADTGSGMGSEVLEKVFEPFFSTKFTGRGLGLAVVLGIVKAHEGAIGVWSQPGAGAVFRVFLPLVAVQPPRPVQPASVAPKTGPGRGLVLAVDDDPMLRNLVPILLKHVGYQAIGAADGAEALEIFRRRRDEICCVLCDLTMPGMNGWETLAALRQIRPDIPVILCSGYDEARVMAGQRDHRPQAFLGKPYDHAALKAALEKALAGA